MNTQSKVMEIYDHLFKHFGPQHWWPGDTQEEIILGAILTQAVSWSNVEKAISNLKDYNLIDFTELNKADDDLLRQLIRPTLYHGQKARKIRAFLEFLDNSCQGSLSVMWSDDLPNLRSRLLQVWGIGPETADSILLYAGGLPAFVVDAYTVRIFTRLGLIREGVGYHELQQFLEANTPAEAAVYNEYHALLVALGKHICTKSKPICFDCPLSESCKYFLTMAGNEL